MHIPFSLQEAIARELASVEKKSVTQGRLELSERYRQKKTEQPFMTTAAHRASYLATRMPATYAAVVNALVKTSRALPGLEIESMLDLGAGPGTGMWAAKEIFSQLAQFTLFENDAELIACGQRLASQNPQLCSAQWEQVDLEKCEKFPRHDLVILSYSFGEVNNSGLLDKAIEAAEKLLVVIEPGTPTGFERIRLVRSKLIQAGLQVAAPCPHDNICPMSGDDWCHFSARVARSALHRAVKGGELAYEDEKFSYVAACRQRPQRPQARVLRHPQKRTGHINLSLCAPQGLVEVTLSKKDKERYKLARKLEWGDDFFPLPLR